MHPKCTEILNSLGQRDILSSAYLFYGQSGAGFEAAADTFVGQYLNRTSLENVPDVIRFHPDAAIKIDTIRDIQKNIQYGPSQDKHLFVIMHNAHLMTTQAANAFLKTLEEPPTGVSVILTTPQPAKLIATIHSRCQKLFFPTPQATLESPSVTYNMFMAMSDFEKLQLAQELSTDKPRATDTLYAWMSEIWSLDLGKTPQKLRHLELLADKVIDLGYTINLRLHLESLFLKLN